MELSRKKIALGVAIAVAIAVIAYFVRKGYKKVSCYVWDSYDPSKKVLPAGILGGVGKVIPVAAKGPDGTWALGGTFADPESLDWAKIAVPPKEGFAFTATQIWFLRLRDSSKNCPLRPMAKSDTQVMFNGIPVCYSPTGVFAASVGACPQGATYATFFSLADAMA